MPGWLRCVSNLADFGLSLLRPALAALLLAAWGLPASAHKASDAYLQLAGGAGVTTLRIDVALRDLDVALDLDGDGDGKLTWREVRSAWPLMERYLRTRVELDGCPLSPVSQALERRIDGVYAALTLQSSCAPAQPPGIRYGVMDDVDPTHRGLARIEWAGQAGTLRVLTPQRVRVTLANDVAGSVNTLTPQAPASAPVAANSAATPVAAPVDANSAATPVAATAPAPDQAASPLQFVREGARHILAGYDHVLFLICLLLPSVLRRSDQGWQPVPNLKLALIPVVGIVTAFTVAHSITLALAATGVLTLPPSFIEPAIALTIMLTALDNLWPIFRVRRVWVTFAFGLIHGFGFAGVLAELNLPVTEFAWALFQFNLGIEAGQLVIVAVVTTLLFALRSQRTYPAVFVRGGSIVAMGLATLWLVERVANVSILPI